ncbi:MAG: SIS domain-containing protein [Solirubrobacteraceae bacterium]
MNDRRDFTLAYRDRLVDALLALEPAALGQALELFQQTWLAGGLVLLAGNGGSATTAEHMDLDLSKTIARVAGAGMGFRSIALTHSAAVTAWSNDVGAAEIFAGQIRDLGRAGDLLVVFSAKGNSPNIISALEAAREIGLTTVGFLGAGGGLARKLVDAAVVVASDDYGAIEDVHLAINHLLVDHLATWVTDRPTPAA